MSGELIINNEGNCVTLELHRPDKRNALSAALIEELIVAVDKAEASGAEMLVLRGSGKNFSAGFDFTGWREHSEGDLVLRFIRIEILLQKLASLSATTVAMAHGRNFGAGVDLFAACDHRIATSDASFCMPGLKFGLVLGTRRFAALVGVGAARSILAESRTFDSAEAMSVGFLTMCAEISTWSHAVEETIATPSGGQPLLETALQIGQSDTDLAELVRSAASPGLKGRIEAYLKKVS